MLVTPQGNKLWRLAYRFAGKPKNLVIGEYPSVPLADARAKREEAKMLLANGIDPSMTKKAANASNQEAATNSFDVIAREWHTTNMANKTLANFEKDVFPWLGRMPMTNIEAPRVLAVFKRIEQRVGNEIAKKTIDHIPEPLETLFPIGSPNITPPSSIRFKSTHCLKPAKATPATSPHVGRCGCVSGYVATWPKSERWNGRKSTLIGPNAPSLLQPGAMPAMAVS